MSAWYESLVAMRLVSAMFAVSDAGLGLDAQSACPITRDAAAFVGSVKCVWAKGFDGINTIEGRVWQFQGACEDLRRLLDDLRTQWMERQMIAQGFRKEFLMAPSPRADERAASLALMEQTPDIDEALDAFVERRQAVRSAAA